MGDPGLANHREARQNSLGIGGHSIPFFSVFQLRLISIMKAKPPTSSLATIDHVSTPWKASLDENYGKIATSIEKQRPSKS
jgi:hypothetical protein